MTRAPSDFGRSLNFFPTLCIALLVVLMGVALFNDIARQLN